MKSEKQILETNELKCPSCGWRFTPFNPPFEDTGGNLVTYCPHCLMYFEVKKER